MAILTKAQLEALNQSSFPDNSVEAITPAILRTYNTATIDTLVDSLDTGSFTTDITSLNDFTASQESKDQTLASYTASVDTKFATIGSQSGSWVNVPLDSLNAFTASQETKNSTLATYTASVDTKFSTIGGVTASLQQQLTNIGSQSGSWVTESETGSFARTDVSNTFTTSQTIQGGLNVTGTITANEIHTIIESSSVIYSSGSNILGDAATDTQTLNGSVNVVNQLTASGLHYPTADGASGQFIVTNGAGTLSFSNNNVLTDQIRSGEAISIGDPLYISGSNGTRPVVWKADASNPAKMPVTYIAQASVGANTNTTGITLGDITGVTTTGYPAGTTIYVAEGGGWSANRPSGSNSIVQALGIVTKEGAGGSGVGLVLNPGPATLPNIQTGYVWVGNGSNQPTAVATSSLVTNPTDISALNAFTASQNTKNATLATYTASVDTKFQTLGGLTGSYATTGSNIFIGAQTITGSLNLTANVNAGGNISADSLYIQSGITSSGQVNIVGGAGLSISANLQGSGSAYANGTAIVDDITDPTNVYSSWQLVGQGGNTLIAIAANSYTAEYPNTTIPYLFGGGNNPGGTNAGIAFPTDGTAEIWKKSNFKYGVDVTGSLNVGGINVSSSIALNNQKWNNISSQSGSWGGGSINTGSFATTGSNIFIGNQTITGSLNQSGSTNTLWGQTTINNDLIVANGGGANIGGTILAQSNIQVLNGSGISLQANLQGSGSAYPNITSIVDNVTDPTNVYGSFQLIDQNQNALIAIAANSYTGEYPGITIPMLFGGGVNPNLSNAGIAFPTDGTAEVWKKSNFKFGVDVTGSLLVNGLNVSSSIATNNQKWNNIAAQSGSWSGGGAAFPYTGSAQITGSLGITGSMSGLVTELTVSSNTASIDFRRGNFFSITLPGAATTRFEVSNSIKGQTVNIQINQPAGASTGSVVFAPSILFAGGNDYQATATGSAIDLLTMVAITGSSVLATSIKNFQ